MNAEALDYALEQAYAPPPTAAMPSPVEPLSAGITEAMEDCARSLARQHRLINDKGQLYCWNCGERCPWHVSLHCTPCRIDSIRQAPDRQRHERETRRREQELARQQSQPQQRVGNRSFRDG